MAYKKRDLSTSLFNFFKKFTVKSIMLNNLPFSKNFIIGTTSDQPKLLIGQLLIHLS